MDSTQAKLFTTELVGKTIGGWLIDGPLGYGKSAIVLSASRGTDVGAIKVFHPELVERHGKKVQLERINREKTLIGLSHPNLVRILDGGECPDTGHLFVVMEKLPYKNLQQLINALPSDKIPNVISNIASAARFLEDHDLVHRDIKPENIAISDDFSKAILLDFGVIRPLGDSSITDQDQRPFIGTLRYSSPEFLLREEKNWRAVTFYQLGAVLHDLLMRKPLFAEFSEPYPVLVRAVLEETPRIVGDNPRLVQLARKALVKKPETRLELVDWNDFLDDKEQETDAINTVRQKILQRQKLSQATLQVAGVGDAEKRRLFKQQLDSLCGSFETRLSSILNGLNCFPLRTTKAKVEISKSECHVDIYFEKDERLGMPVHLISKFVITHIDENNGIAIYRADFCAAISDTEEICTDDFTPLKTFSKGTQEDIFNDATIEQVLLNALEAAYNYLDAGNLPGKGNAVVLTK